MTSSLASSFAKLLQVKGNRFHGEKLIILLMENEVKVAIVKVKCFLKEGETLVINYW